MAGIQHDLGREATLRVLQHQGSGYCAGVLRSVLTGSNLTHDRFYRRKQEGHIVTSPICIYCDSGSADDLDHLFWCCAAWDTVRQADEDIARQDPTTWPLCLDIAV